MFSRLSCFSVKGLTPVIRSPAALQVRVVHDAVEKREEQKFVIKEGPERDLVNFPRRIRPLYPGKVRLAFIPEEWFQFFYKKTGVTGPYLFTTGLLTYVWSKEIWVMEHEFYNGLALAILIFVIVKTTGPKVAAYADKQNDEYEKKWNDFRNNSIDQCKEMIEFEKKEQWRAQGHGVLFDAKRENVHLQLESEYRKRLMTAYTEVKKRLDYQVELLNAGRRLEQRHMVKWIVDNVVKGITPQQEKEAIQQCIANLKTLSAKGI